MKISKRQLRRIIKEMANQEQDFVVSGYSGGYSSNSERYDYIVRAKNKSDAKKKLRAAYPHLRKIGATPVSFYSELNPYETFERLSESVNLRGGAKMKISKTRLRRIIREEYSRLKRRGLIKESMSPSDPNYELVGDVIETCKMECVDNGITHPDDIYAFCFELAREHGVEDKADYIAELVHGWVAYVLN